MGDRGSSNEGWWLKFFRNALIPPPFDTKYAAMFEENRMRRDMLMDITMEILRAMGITAMGDIIAILKHAKKVYGDDDGEVVIIKSEDNTFDEDIHGRPTTASSQGTTENVGQSSPNSAAEQSLQQETEEQVNAVESATIQIKNENCVAIVETLEVDEDAGECCATSELEEGEIVSDEEEEEERGDGDSVEEGEVVSDEEVSLNTSTPMQDYGFDLTTGEHVVEKELVLTQKIDDSNNINEKIADKEMVLAHDSNINDGKNSQHQLDPESNVSDEASGEGASLKCCYKEIYGSDSEDELTSTDESEDFPIDELSSSSESSSSSGEGSSDSEYVDRRRGGTKINNSISKKGQGRGRGRPPKTNGAPSTSSSINPATAGPSRKATLSRTRVNCRSPNKFCPFKCGFATYANDAIRNHLSNTHGYQKHYVCEDCGQYFAQAFSLRRHQAGPCERKRKRKEKEAAAAAKKGSGGGRKKVLRSPSPSSSPEKKRERRSSDTS